jgi:cytochrome c-type biogenesis protein CcmF
MGVVLMFVGFTGAAFNKDTTVEVTLGQQFDIGRYHLEVRKIEDGGNENYQWQRAVVAAFKNGQFLGELRPERRVYLASEQPTSEVAIRRRLNEDLYLNFASMSQTDASKAVIQAYVFPLVSWIWVGFWVMLVGTIVCLIPSKQKLAYAKTGVVGVYAKEPAAAQ